MKIERNVDVPMRDGTILRADVFRPSKKGTFPVLVMRTPYNKKGKRFDRFVAAGYIVVSQDARGRFQSEGEWESFARMETHDAVDGYDTIEWAAKLPGSNGKVGTFGSSYNSFLQWRAASLNPPSLVAMAAQTIPAKYTDLEGPGTIRPGRRLKWWFSSMTPDLRRRHNREGNHSKAEAIKKWNEGGYDKWMYFLPWSKLPQEAFEDETEHVQNWLKNPHLDPWKLDADAKNVTVPNLDVVGWYDHCNGNLDMYKTISSQGKSKLARTQSKIVVGPWSHAGRGKTGYGNIKFGSDAAYDLTGEQIRWFDYWIKCKKNGVEKDAPVKIFVMGDNVWRDEPKWPLERAKTKVFHLTSGGKANTPAGNGGLVTSKPKEQGIDRYVYHPRDPVLSLHGAALFTIPTDQMKLKHRQDILVYQTEPLSERIEVTGNPKVELWAQSSAPDTDFFVRLIDVAPSGIARDVALGMVRARYRNSLKNPKLLKKNELVKYTIELGPTSNAFLPGHRLRLDITSSDFPNYDRNHNTATDQNADAKLVKATQTILHGGKTATKLILPWVTK